MGILTNYQRPTAPNRYADDIAALAKAGEDAAYELIAPTKAAEGVRGSISTEHAAFQEAAREAEFTARQVESEDREDGTTRRVYVLTAKRGHTRRDKSAEAATEVADTK